MTENELNKKFEKLWPEKTHRLWRPPKAKFRSQDIFGLFDYVVVSNDGVVSFYQISTATHRSHRVNKVVNWCRAFFKTPLWPKNWYIATYDPGVDKWTTIEARYSRLIL